MNLKKIGKVFTSKFVGTWPLSYEKKNLPGRGLTDIEKFWFRWYIVVYTVHLYQIFFFYPKFVPTLRTVKWFGKKNSYEIHVATEVCWTMCTRDSG